MSSQKDLFAENSDTEVKKMRKTKVSSSFDPQQKKIQHKYSHVCLFNFNVDLSAPFAMYKLSMFTEQDLNPEWISKNLGVTSRIVPLRNLSPFPGQSLALFAKVEIGMYKFNIIFIPHYHPNFNLYHQDIHKIPFFFGLYIRNDPQTKGFHSVLLE